MAEQLLGAQELYAHAHPSTPAVDPNSSGHPSAEGPEEPGSIWDMTHRVHMIAGAAAGMGEHTAMFPVDVVKTRMQSLRVDGQPRYGGISHALKEIVRMEGPRRLWRGVSAVAIGAAPSHALYFASFEVCKDALGGNAHDSSAVTSGVAGAVGTVISDAVLTPADVVKQRMQLFNSPYKSVSDCFFTVLRQEGVGAFYASYKTTVVMNVPTFFVQFGSYEFLKRVLKAREDADSWVDGLVTHGIAGGGAGALAAFVTNPLDVCKTRLQCQGSTLNSLHLGDRMYSGVWGTFVKVFRDEGVAGLMGGWKPRVLFHTPAAAICWSVYELTKGLLLIPDIS